MEGSRPPAESKVWFTVLGPLGAEIDGKLLPLGGAKQQLVLARLLLEAGRMVPASTLVEWVWGADDTSARLGTLQVYVSNLRRVLAPASECLAHDLIVTRKPGYFVQLDESDLDLLAFESFRKAGDAAAASGRPGQAVAAYRSALALWRGQPLSGLPIEAGGTAMLAGLELARIGLLERIAECDLALGRHRECLAEVQGWLADHPLDERLRGHVMLAMYRAGRQADALAVYRAGRELLAEELGLEPSRELRDLETAILLQDPSLDLGRDRPHPLDDEETTAMRSSAIDRTARLELPTSTVRIERSLTTIGRMRDRDLVLDDPDVSRVHAEIRRAGTGYRLVDAGSANGTVVNGESVTDHVLVDGDVIRLGATVITFRASPA